MRSTRRYLSYLALGASAAAWSPGASAQTIVKPEFLFIVDTSGSMNASTGAGNNSCGYVHTRINDAACVVRNIADGVGTAMFGFETFSFTCSAAGCHYSSGNNLSCGVLGSATCGNTLNPNTAGELATTGLPYAITGCEDSASIHVAINDTNPWELRTWGDGTWSGCGEPSGLVTPTLGGNELAGNAACPNGLAVSNTPLAGALRVAWRYLTAPASAARPSPYIRFNGTGAADPYPSCRPLNIIFLTDGGETCNPGGGANGPLWARQNAFDIGCLAVDLDGNGRIDNPNSAGRFESNVDLNGDRDCYDANEQRAFRTRTYVIGFGTGVGDASIEQIAQGGGVPTHPVGGAGSYYGYYANNEAEISAAISDIISQSDLREVCNGRDDNCNGMIDEGFAFGACSVGVGACRRTGTLACNAAQDNTTCNVSPGAPGVEAGNCGDGVDNDCDGLTDCQDTDCAANSVCNGSCIPTPEVCNGRDDNCNGMIDEGTLPLVGQACGSSVGACRPGVYACTAGTLTCAGGVLPTAETCDNVDNDCNGAVDDGALSADPRVGVACGGGMGECRAGRAVCQMGMVVCQGAGVASPEVCDGLDNNCDGMVDNGIASTGSCGVSGVGVCAAGTLQCVMGSFRCVGATMPGTETCNGLDDDCNGRVDDGVSGTGASCQPTGMMIPVDSMGRPVGACRLGTTVCVSAAPGMGGLQCQGAVGPTAEVCNGLDDNCNGVIDDGITLTGTCGSSVGVCRPGTPTCMGGRMVCMGSVDPSPEVCDGMDNNCDGMVDEGNPGGGTACGTSTGACSPGVQTCMGGRLVCMGGRQPMMETCNGVDDDCDGMVDNGVPEGAPCGSNVGECRPGTTACVMGAEVCVGSRGPRAEECNCRDDDCDGTVDNMATGGAPLCGSGSVCAGAPYCACLRPCSSGEFPCPVGRTCQAVDGRNLCVGDLCATVNCPSGQNCDQSTGMCRDNCAGVTCASGLVCNPATGTCVRNDCRILNNCTAGQLCVSGMCVTDPCAGVNCPTGQACYNGTCAPTCANVTCPTGQTCTRGVCSGTMDRCANVTCMASQVCNPADGTCTSNRCIGGRMCGQNQVCDPVSGNCVDDPCAMVRCPTNLTCRAGQCVDPTSIQDAGTTMTSPRERVIGTGGGAVACAVAGTPGRSTDRSPFALFAGLALVAAAARRRRSA